MTKPDFIIIGAMKSATSTLHAQLATQPGIFMSTPKEPNYFSDDAIYSKGEQWYHALFDEAHADDLCGESSTHYTKLPDYALTVERMAQQLKNPKFIYVMRHPIDRLVSHYIHQWSQNVITCDINEAIDRHEELISYSCYTKQLEPYFEQFGQNNILPVFNEAIRESAQYQLERIANFIGYQGKVVWQYESGTQNVSKDRLRTFKGYHWLVESKFMTSLRRTLVPQVVRDKVKHRLTMQERPEIDSAHLSKLTHLFDQDLERLGHYLGIKLSCDNFIHKVQKTDCSWMHS